MKHQSVKIVSAAISDRGLSKKRPLNEDSFLADAERRIFAVADGVGGAQAGEVASQTAIEVLDEAFRHLDEEGDAEDLMEIAIQRANSSIHRMAAEHPKLQMMATTIVSLHLDGHIATIGHVGDSRLYRLTPDGQIHRETRDHSVVEEEVRAGRMTAAQAAHHPSRNVISRALGAEESVEVDMKTIEVTDGTAFLLCSDGITRHLPDDELAALLNGDQEPDAICAEMKRLCYERGAEDNLTAVIIRVGESVAAGTQDGFDDERTVISARGSLAATMSGENKRATSNTELHETVADSDLHETVDAVKHSTKPTPSPSTAAQSAPASPAYQSPATAVNTVAPPRSSAGGKVVKTLFLLLLIAGVGAAAFFGGMYKQRLDTEALANQTASATPTPTPIPPAAAFEQKRREVDATPAKMAAQMATEQTTNPNAATDPEFMYLYGRSMLLTGKYTEAMAAFKRTNELMNGRAPRDWLRIETKLSAVVAAMKSNNLTESNKAVAALDEIIEPESKTLSSGQANDQSKPFGMGADASASTPVASPR